MNSMFGGEARKFRTGQTVLVVLAIFLCSMLPARAQQGEGQRQIQLPEGKGKEIIERACVQCHGLERIARSGFTRQEWQRVLDRQVMSGATLPPDQLAVVTDYLTINFPDKSPKAVVVPGRVEVSIREWTVPTPGSRPHDPLVAPDGSIWYTGQLANVLGRFDPTTEQFKEYPLAIEKSGPHGLTADRDGNIWFTANSGAYVGKLDPKTGRVTEYKMPDPKARDPHTPIFDQKGTLFFTLQGANMVGRINPKTGEVKVVSMPTPRSNPYGMVVDSKGVVFFCEFGGNRLASIDPDTMELREYTLPNPDTRPRRIAITPDDVLWYSDYSRGYLGRFDPKTGEAKEWPSPGGPNSQPYGIAAIDKILWYSESGVKPNTMVRFDPQTEKFQTWVIPSGGGVVRNMMPSPDGRNVWLATSGVNGIARVEIKND
ncbi:MAG: PQQ-binding-like beta-propeller repeat protein [Acidobacteria bacterium]|nr:PQQ-binding-like beta-propeller repeat protein [Acidobacteriota bacterium]